MTSTTHISRSIREEPRRGGGRPRGGDGSAGGLFLHGRQGRQPPSRENKASGDSVVVGSNNFPESTLLADIYGEALKAKGIKVTYKPNIGSRETTYGLIKNGSISVLPEYNGALLAYLDPKATPKTLGATTSAINAKLDSKLTLLNPSAAEDRTRSPSTRPPRRSTGSPRTPPSPT
ncbi:hypothetical protein LT493_39240 [Streptomyces tricolor]|nr:hypothetical protein [Streptomyces tricolor]